jgi:hypothetical protein
LRSDAYHETRKTAAQSNTPIFVQPITPKCNASCPRDPLLAHACQLLAQPWYSLLCQCLQLLF